MVGSDATVDFALRLVRRRGTVSVIGVQQSRRFAFPLERAFAAVPEVSIERCALDVIEVMDALGVETATVIGHSWGGAVAARRIAFVEDQVDDLQHLG